MVSPAVVGTGSTNKVSGTAQTKASAKKSGDFKSVMADSLANGATNGNIGKTNIKDNLINVQNTNTNKISAKNNTSEDKSSVTGSAKNADTSSISDVNSKADNKDVTDTVKEVCEDIKDAIKEEFDVSDEDINHELGHMREHNSRLISIEDRPVEKGDITVIDFEGFVDGKAFEGGKAEGHELEIGSNTFIPGFEDQIIGMKIDEERDIKVKFPDEYFSKDLAGKDATFKVKLHEIKKKELPELDDEFAKDVSEFDTLEELKKSIKDRIEKDNEQKQKYETEDAVIKAVCENVKVDIPSGMIETETEDMLRNIETRLSYQGLKLEQYLQMMGKTAEEVKKEYEPQAIEAIKSRLMLEAVIKAEKIEATEDEILEKMKEMAKNYGKSDDKEFMENENVRKYIKSGLESEKALEFLVKNAKIKK